MEYRLSVFTLITVDGAALTIRIREDDLNYGSVVNALCGIKPRLWLGRSSHHRIIQLNSDLRNLWLKLFSDLQQCAEDIENVRCFFQGVRENGFMAIIRQDAYPPVTDDILDEYIQQLKNYDLGDLKAKYDMHLYGNETYYAGPQDLRNCVCRFCKKSYPDVRFKKNNAHAIPDALGNKLVFCNDECKTCNNKLSSVEKNLINYLNFRRAEHKILGKKSRIIQNFGQNYVLDGKTGSLEYSNEVIIEKKSDHSIAKFLDANLITHLGIYKALCKIAVNLMPNDRLYDFENTIEWIKGNIRPHTAPNVYFAYRKCVVTQPVFRMYLRKDAVDSDVPHCFGVLDLIDLRFYYIVPYAKSDGKLFLKENAIDNYMHFLISLDNDNIGYEIIDMSDRVGKFSHVVDSIKNSQAKFIDASKFDHAKEKNPNNVEFPTLNLNHVTIRHAEISKLRYNFDRNILKYAKIEQTDIEIILLECKRMPLAGWFVLNLEFSINELCYRQELFNASIKVVVKHDSPDEVCSICEKEISFHLLKYMIELGIDKLAEKASNYMPSFNFKLLPQFIEENKLYVYPSD